MLCHTKTMAPHGFHGTCQGAVRHTYTILIQGRWGPTAVLLPLLTSPQLS